MPIRPWHSWRVVAEAQGTNQRWAVAALAAAVPVAALLVVITCWHGPGVNPDSVVYLDAARHVAAGHGPQATNALGEAQLVTTWPPLYPLLIAPGVAAGLTAANSAVLVNALAHAALALLVGLIAWRLTRCAWAGALGAWLATLASPLLLNAGHVWSEPAFLALECGALLCLLKFANSGRRLPLAAGGVLLGLACMQRYAGYALVAAALAWMLQLRPHGGWRATAMLAAAAVPLPLLWRVVVIGTQGAVDARGTSFAFPTGLHFQAVGYSLSAWILPLELPTLIRAAGAIAVLLALLTGVVFAVRLRRADSPLAAPALLLALFAVCFSTLVAVTILFMDHLLQANERILSPLLPLVLIALVWLLFSLSGRARVAGIVLLCLLGLSYAVRDVGAVALVHRGVGYAAPEYRDSPTLHAALAQPGTVYASNPQPLILHGKPARAVPGPGVIEYLMPAGHSPWPDVPAARAEMARELEYDGAIAWFYRDGSPEPLKRELGLRTVGFYTDGELLVPIARK
jgi:hypothetical protein